MVRVASYLVIFSSSAAATWHEMPNGMYYHEDCIHQFDDAFHVKQTPEGGSSVSFGTGERESLTLPPCPHAPRASPEELTVSANSSSEANVGYYSAWSVYAKTARPKGFGYMSSKWSVPAKPTKRGPAGQSSVYLFNGLEDGGGVLGASSLILQPVLQYGKSGCIINPLKWSNWWLTSYLVDGNGRAYCGARLGPLKEGEELVGEMTLTNAADNTWRVDSTRLKTGEVSTHSTTLNDVVLDAAYATMEGMIIYNCQSFPDSGSCTFEENKLSDRDGNAVSATWTKMIPKTECGQDVDVSGDTITLRWDTSITDEAVTV